MAGAEALPQPAFKLTTRPLTEKSNKEQNYKRVSKTLTALTRISHKHCFGVVLS